MLRTTLKSIWSRKRRLVSASVAVVLGVAFLVGTMVVGDTVKSGFTEAFTEMTDGTDVVVRSATRIGGPDERVTGLVDAAELDAIAELPGVASVAAEVDGTAQIVTADGELIGDGEGPPLFAVAWIDDPNLSVLALADGRAPGAVADGERLEIVINVAAADDGGIAVGDDAFIHAPQRIPVTVVGLATVNGEDSLGGTTYVALETGAAQGLLLGADDMVSAILVHAEEGVTSEQLRDTIAAALPDGLEAITGAELTAELNRDIDDDFLGVFRIILLVFAGIAVVVATFSIHNTFSILIAQRTRESALLRAIGASRRQVLATVGGEALAVGIVATALGFGAGIGIGSALLRWLESGGGLPVASIVVNPGTIIAAVLVGVGTTLLASLTPAVKAARVAPLAALRDVAAERTGLPKVRAAVGAVFSALGIAWLVSATSAGDNALGRAGLGAAVLVVGCVVLGPVAARPAAAVLGILPARLRGVTGSLARGNAMRNPRRTAASASALMIGTAVVALFTTFGASLKATINQTVDSGFHGDLVVLAHGWGGPQLSPELPAVLADVDAVEAAVGIGYTTALVDGDTAQVATTELAELGAIMDVELAAGSLDGFGAGEVAVSAHYAERNDLATGSTLEVGWADGETEALTVAAIYGARMTLGDIAVALDTAQPHIPRPELNVVLVGLDDSVPVAAGQAAVQERTAELGVRDPMNRDQYKDEVAGEIDSMLTFVYGMLAVAIIIAVMAVGNTLSLSIHDRTRELGLLRAVGQTRSQMRSSVRWESVIVAVFGTIGGVGLGAFCGWGLMRALASAEDFGTFSLPIGQLAIVVALAATAGVLAAVRPARRAARTDILAAIASS